MPGPSLSEITDALRGWRPGFCPRGQELSEAVKLEAGADGGLELQLSLGYPAALSAPGIEARLRERLGASGLALDQLSFRIDWKVRAHSVQRQLRPGDKVRNVIAVASGKGGVGKSTVAANLALALAAEGARIGMLDADIYGPSQPRMLGVSGAPALEGEKTLLPLSAHGIQVMSVGFLVEEEKPVIWRGPMVSGALRQLFDDCAWDELDYLIIDLPPGTGDIQLTLAQRIPVTGVVVVTTPQQIAVADARKSVRMFEKVGVPVLGLAENMSRFVCPSCGHASEIFAGDGADALGRELGLDVLGAIPLNPGTCLHGDGGKPDVLAAPESPAAKAFFALAHHTAVAVAARPLDYTRKFGRIEVQATGAAEPGSASTPQTSN